MHALRAVGVLVILSSIVPIALLFGGSLTTEPDESNISESLVKSVEPLPVSVSEGIPKSEDQVIQQSMNASEVESENDEMVAPDDVQVQDSNFISGYLTVGRTWLGIHPSVVEPRATSNVSIEVMGTIPNLERAIMLHEEQVSNWLEVCRTRYQRNTLRECMSSFQQLPDEYTVYISGDEFKSIEDNLMPVLSRQEIRNAGVMEEGLERRILMPNGEVIVEQTKTFVEREPREGEEIVPAQVEKSFSSFFFYRGIEYHAVISVTQSLPLESNQEDQEEHLIFLGALLSLQRVSGSELEVAESLIQNVLAESDLVGHPKFRSAFEEIHLRTLDWESVCTSDRLRNFDCPVRPTLYLDLTESEFLDLMEFSNLALLEPDRSDVQSSSGNTERSYDSIIEFEGVWYIILLDSLWSKEDETRQEEEVPLIFREDPNLFLP